MKKLAYLLGVVSGVVLAYSWKILLKESVKAGVSAGRAIRRVSEQAFEDIEDASAEAMEELAREDRKDGH
jgi:hypothetical protein